MSGPLSVYRDMFDAQALDHVDDIDGGGVPVGHAFWLMLPALILSVVTLSATPLVVAAGTVLLWTVGGAVFYWRIHRRYRLAAGLPVWPMARYLVRPALSGLATLGGSIGGQALFRYFH